MSACLMLAILSTVLSEAQVYMWLLRLHFSITEWLRFTLCVGLVGMILSLVESRLLLLTLQRLVRRLSSTRPMGLPGVLVLPVPLLFATMMGPLFMTMLRSLGLMVLVRAPPTRLLVRRTRTLET